MMISGVLSGTGAKRDDSVDLFQVSAAAKTGEPQLRPFFKHGLCQALLVDGSSARPHAAPQIRRRRHAGRIRNRVDAHIVAMR